MLSVADRVNAGIAVLDDKVPDWRTKINVETLDVMSFGNCVLGQVLGDFEKYHDLDIKSPVSNYGFDINTGEINDWLDLNDEWKRRLST